MKHFRLKIPVPEVETRAHVYDFYRNEGYFPITLRTGKVLMCRRHPIWLKSRNNLTLFVVHHPDLEEWPAITMRCDLKDDLLLFKVDHWKPEAWCKAQSVYLPELGRPKLSQCMIGDDPMLHANLVH